MSVPSHIFEQTLSELFAPVASLLADDEVNEVLINGYDEVYVERAGLLEWSGSKFPSDYALMSALRNLSQYVGRELSERRPILEARLPDGSRVEAVIPPASPRGAVACIRKFRQRELTLARLIGSDTISQRTGELLQGIVLERRNIIVSGGSGAGKTSLLNALASLARVDERVIVIEDSKELQLELPHVLHLEAQPASHEGQDEITVRELLRATLRMRPDRIVIGEIRGGEALDLVQAMTSGHRGCLSTVHGTLPIDALRRLETMALMSDIEIPVPILRAQLASAVDVIVQLARGEDGVRSVTHIVELAGFNEGAGYQIHDLFRSEEVS
jgi:pilus assembly protein CpaF